MKKIPRLFLLWELQLQLLQKKSFQNNIYSSVLYQIHIFCCICKYSISIFNISIFQYSIFFSDQTTWGQTPEPDKTNEFLNFQYFLLTLADLGWLWLTLAAFGGLWLTLADFGWLWRTLADFGWLWRTFTDFSWLWLTVADYPFFILYTRI